MLRDFLLLEHYFGHPDSLQPMEDVVTRYGAQTVREAINAGHLILRSAFLKPEGGSFFCALSESGRKKALTENVDQARNLAE